MTAEANGTRAAATSVVEHLRSLIRLERELAVTELRRKTAMTAGGIGAVIAAVLLSFFVVALGIAVVVAALALVLDVWLALLVVFVLVLALTGGLGIVAATLLRRRGSLYPEQAIGEARRIREILGRGSGR